MTKRVFCWVIERLNLGQKVALASVLSTQGSVPGKTGAKLALTKDEITGTIGGAGLELQVISRLRDLLEKQNPFAEVISFGLNKGAKGYEVIPLDSLCGGRVTLSLEVMIPMPHVLMMGGGHCAEALSEILSALDWDFSVCDSREEYASLNGAKESIHASVETFFENENATSLSRFSDILLLGHDWKEDEMRLISLLGLNYQGRLGVIGSKSKWKAFVEAANSAGIEKSLLEAVRCPIGLNIGAETPEEIAVAVAAEIMGLHKQVQVTSPNWRQKE